MQLKKEESVERTLPPSFKLDRENNPKTKKIELLLHTYLLLLPLRSPLCGLLILCPLQRLEARLFFFFFCKKGREARKSSEFFSFRARFSSSLSPKKNQSRITSISALAALSRASLSILSTRSASLRLPLAYVWKVPDPAPAADPWMLETMVGTFCVMKASFSSRTSA